MLSRQAPPACPATFVSSAPSRSPSSPAQTMMSPTVLAGQVQRGAHHHWKPGVQWPRFRIRPRWRQHRRRFCARRRRQCRCCCPPGHAAGTAPAEAATSGAGSGTSTPWRRGRGRCQTRPPQRQHRRRSGPRRWRWCRCRCPPGHEAAMAYAEAAMSGADSGTLGGTAANIRGPPATAAPNSVMSPCPGLQHPHVHHPLPLPGQTLSVNARCLVENGSRSAVMGAGRQLLQLAALRPLHHHLRAVLPRLEEHRRWQNRPQLVRCLKR
mmetsp:Transcript_53985/g.149696  ORF Transcript_53985/g.149696 Transcript_53985/m.149696 type:complete len:267 (-) Transcript_53985:176-976(-)